MHEYSRDDIRECLAGKRVLFVGDSTMRVLFFAALTRLDHEAAEWLLRTTFIERNPRHDLSIESETVQLQFIWDPWLNSTLFEEELRRFEPGGDNKNVDSADKPDLVIIGSAGLWAARNTADDLYFDTFRAATDHVSRVMVNTVQPFGKHTTDNYVFLAPVQIPRYELLLPDRAQALSPERITRMNGYLASLPTAVKSHILTAYNEMTYQVPEAYEDTGLHVSDAVAERWIDVPLNARCNGVLLGGPANRKLTPSMSQSTTCCTAYPRLVRGQKVLWYGICAAVAVSTLVYLFRYRTATLSSFVSYISIGPALLYCYMADRTHLFAKSEKHYEVGWMWCILVACSICFVASYRSHTQPRNAPQTLSSHRASVPEAVFLPRHISDEWKGLMQAAILIFAYQDDSCIPFAARWTEFATVSYLFLSAFGHTSYFLWFRDFSLRRVALVLLRLNLLPSLLALMLDGKDMGTPNSVSRLVTFSRLISFWFLVVYTTLRIGSKINQSQPHVLLLKIFVSAAVVCVVLCLRKFGVFEILDRITQLLLGRPTMWDIPKMHQAVLTAWCGPFAGMVVAVLAQRVAILCDRMQRHQQQKQQLLSGQEPPLPGHAETNTTKTKTSTDSNAAMPSGARANAGIMTGTGIFSHYTSLKDTSARNSISKDACFLDRLLVAILYPNEFMAPVQAMVIIFSSVFLFGYASATTVSPALDGKKASPCLTTAAVVCFAIVRNAHARLRAIYMALPAALGAIALELSVLHNHVLLSGNGTGHLRLSPFYSPVVEHSGGSLGEYIAAAKAAVMHSLGIASITAVFLIVSWHTHQSVRMLSSKIVGEDCAGDKYKNSKVVEKSAANVEDVGLPQHNGDITSSFTVDGVGLKTSSTFLRAGGVLVFFWVLNRFYL